MVCWAVGSPPGILCSVVWDLQRCLEPLIERDIMLDASMREVVREESVASLTPMEEAVLLGEGLGPQKDQALYTSVWPEEASEHQDAISQGVMASVPQNAQRQIPPPPLVFAQLLAIRSGPPPLEDADLPMGIPRGVLLNLASLGSTQIVI